MDFTFKRIKYGRFEDLTYIANKINCEPNDLILNLNMFLKIKEGMLELHGCKSMNQKNGVAETVKNSMFLKLVTNSTWNSTEISPSVDMDRNITTEEMSVAQEMQKTCLFVEEKMKLCKNNGDELKLSSLFALFLMNVLLRKLCYIINQN